MRCVANHGDGVRNEQRFFREWQCDDGQAFPLPGGDVVGFSCRVIGPPPEGATGDPPPKYINSPESSVYKKSKLLFGLAQARIGDTDVTLRDWRIRRLPDGRFAAKVDSAKTCEHLATRWTMQNDQPDTFT